MFRHVTIAASLCQVIYNGILSAMSSTCVLFASIAVLSSHMKPHYNDTEERMKCERARLLKDCNKVFQNDIHARRLYACHLCNALYASGDRLGKHLRQVHTLVPADASPRFT